MSAAQPIEPTPVTAPGAPALPGMPVSTALLPERRGLILILTAAEFALMLVPLFLTSSPQPVPVVGYGPPPCVTNGGGGFSGPGGTTTSGVSCSTLGNLSDPSQSLFLIAVLCTLLGLLVLPVLIGALSRRWQTAIALPSIPFWVLTILLGLLALFLRGDFSNGGSFDPLQAYSQIFSLVFATPIILMVLIAGSLGALAWCARRGLAR